MSNNKKEENISGTFAIFFILFQWDKHACLPLKKKDNLLIVLCYMAQSTDLYSSSFFCDVYKVRCGGEINANTGWKERENEEGKHGWKDCALITHHDKNNVCILGKNCFWLLMS